MILQHFVFVFSVCSGTELSTLQCSIIIIIMIEL